MNKLEQRYQQYLDLQKRAEEIICYRFEAVKFRLADKTFYTPDFMITKSDRIEFHETKGHWEDDAKVKMKVVAEMFPEFGFFAVYWKNKLWEIEEF